MTEQIEHDDPAVLFQNAVCGLNRALRLDRVMQCLAQEHEIDTLFCDRRIFQIAEPVLEVFKTVLFRQL